MKLSVLTVVLFGAGAILIYAAVKNLDPRDLVRETFGQKTEHRPLSTFTPSTGDSAPDILAPGPFGNIPGSPVDPNAPIAYRTPFTPGQTVTSV